MTRTLKTSLLALVLAPALQLALADSAPTTLQTTVRFPDLNLQSRAGATVLYQRIAHAASVMCAPSRELGAMGISAVVSARIRDCKAQAIERAVAQVNAPMLTAVFNDRMHRRPESARLASMK